LGYKKGVFGSFVNETVFIVDPAGPITGEGLFERFGFDYLFKGISSGFFDEDIDTLQDFPVVLLPGEVVFRDML
jgi:hypothetical protein